MSKSFACRQIMIGTIINVMCKGRHGYEGKNEGESWKGKFKRNVTEALIIVEEFKLLKLLGTIRSS